MISSFCKYSIQRQRECRVSQSSIDDQSTMKSGVPTRRIISPFSGQFPKHGYVFRNQETWLRSICTSNFKFSVHDLFIQFFPVDIKHVDIHLVFDDGTRAIHEWPRLCDDPCHQLTDN